MKISKTFLITIAILEFLIIVFGFFYMSSKTQTFQAELPTVMVINIDNEIVSTFYSSILEKRGQHKNKDSSTSSLNVIRMLEFFSQDPNIKAFILEINSNGSQTAAQEDIVRYIKRMNKPVIAVIKGSALSSGYYVAAGTNKIYADESAKIGNIGQTFVYVNRKRNGQEQICNITSENYENIILDSCKGFEQEVFNFLRHYVELTHNTLIGKIVEMREINVNDIIPLSNKIVNSKEALELGLIDEVGDTNDAVKYLENQLDIKLYIINLKDLTYKNET